MALPIFHNFSPSSPWSVTGETKIIGSDGTIFLDYTPQNGSLVISDFTYTESPNNIAAGQFYYDYAVSSNYKAATQIVYFNASKAGTSVTIAYTAVGQVIKADQMNEIKSHLENTEVHVPAISSGTAYLKTVAGADPVWVTTIPWGDISEKPNFADASWKAPVSDISSLPLTGNSAGDLRLVLNDGDSGAIYECVAIAGAVEVQWSKISDFSFATPPWSAITGKPTTLAGYGITDAAALAGNQTIKGIKTFINNPIIQNNAPILQMIESDQSNKNWYIVADVGTFSIRENDLSTQRLCIEEGVLKTTAGGYKFWHEGNDGAGSGLDANLVNGMTVSSSNVASTIAARGASGELGASLMVLGSTSTASTPYIDFHSSGSTNDYDAKIIAMYGTSGTNGVGSLAVHCDQLWKNSMTGRDSIIVINAPSSEYAASIYFDKNAKARWRVLTDTTTESGSNVGSNFAINRFSDDGTTGSTPFWISRDSGQIHVGDANTQFPEQLFINDSTHATSRRAGLRLGTGWLLMQDCAGNGTKDFGIYNTSGALSPFVITAGGTQVCLYNNRASELQFIIDAAAGQYNYINFKKASKPRWMVGCDIGVESGSNTGSDLYFSAWADDGTTWLRNSAVFRRTGEIAFNTSGQTITAETSNFSLTTGKMTLASKYSVQYNSTTDSLDFVYNG